MLMDEAEAKRRLEHDLNIAATSAPAAAQADARLSGYDIAGWNLPADATGAICMIFPAPDGGWRDDRRCHGHGIGLPSSSLSAAASCGPSLTSTAARLPWSAGSTTCCVMICQ